MALVCTAWVLALTASTNGVTGCLRQNARKLSAQGPVSVGATVYRAEYLNYRIHAFMNSTARDNVRRRAHCRGRGVSPSCGVWQHL